RTLDTNLPVRRGRRVLVAWTAVVVLWASAWAIPLPERLVEPPSPSYMAEDITLPDERIEGIAAQDIPSAAQVRQLYRERRMGASSPDWRPSKIKAQFLPHDSKLLSYYALQERLPPYSREEPPPGLQRSPWRRWNRAGLPIRTNGEPWSGMVYVRQILVDLAEHEDGGATGAEASPERLDALARLHTPSLADTPSTDEASVREARYALGLRTEPEAEAIAQELEQLQVERDAYKQHYKQQQLEVLVRNSERRLHMSGRALALLVFVMAAISFGLGRRLRIIRNGHTLRIGRDQLDLRAGWRSAVNEGVIELTREGERSLVFRPSGLNAQELEALAWVLTAMDPALDTA
ncbi:MAG: hypothetical protein KC912_26050, partial [Proteobacteria bacterium]|nr:hypothetical protein [Pseudomonadota bacterium]